MIGHGLSILMMMVNNKNMKSNISLVMFFLI